jgi:hypothetical protein
MSMARPAMPRDAPLPTLPEGILRMSRRSAIAKRDAVAASRTNAELAVDAACGAGPAAHRFAARCAAPGTRSRSV